MTVNPVTNRIYLAIPYSSQQLGVIDGATNKLAAFQIPGLCFTLSIAVDSVLNRIYVQDDLCSVLYVIGGAANNVVATILPGSPGPMGLNPTSHRIADFGTLLSFVNLRTDGIIGTLSFPSGGGGPMSIAAGNNNRYYVALYKSNDIAVVSGPQAAPKRLVKRTP